MSAAKPPIPPVFVVNTGRCGSTLMSRMLALHPAILSISEFLAALTSEALTADRLDGEAFWRLIVRPRPILVALFRAGIRQPEILYRQGRHGPWPLSETPPIMLITLPFVSDAPDRLLAALESEVRAWPPDGLGRQIGRLFDTLADRLDRRRWVERSGDSLPYVERLARLFPEARFIHLYRDGRDVAVSMRGHSDFRSKTAYCAMLEKCGVDPYRQDRAFGVAGGHVWVERLMARLLPIRMLADARVSLAQCGRHWSRQIESGVEALARLDPARVMALRYEDLVATPDEACRRLSAFLGIDDGIEAWIERARALPAARDRTWRDLPADDPQALDNACRSGLDLLGYS